MMHGNTKIKFALSFLRFATLGVKLLKSVITTTNVKDKVFPLQARLWPRGWAEV